MSSRSTRSSSRVAIAAPPQANQPAPANRSSDRSRSRSTKSKGRESIVDVEVQQQEGKSRAEQPDTSADAAVAWATAEAQLAERERLLKQRQAELERREQALQQQLRSSPVASPGASAQASPQLSPQLSPLQQQRSLGAVELPAAAASASAAAAEPSSRFAKKEPRAQDLREYDGAAGAKLDDWLNELALARMLFELNERESVRFAVSRLRGAALQWWLSLGDAGQTLLTDSTALAAALRLRFQPVTAARTAREQLDKLSQGSRSVNDYIADFQRIRTQLPNMAEEDALYAFERGLRRDLAEKLRVEGVTTLQQAIALVARVGGLLASSNTLPGRSAGANQMEIDSGDGAEPSRLDRIEAALNALAAVQIGGAAGMGAKTQTQRGYQQERGGRGGLRGRGGRFGGRGGAGASIPGVPPAVVEQRRAAGQCFRCGSADHLSRECPNAVSVSGN